MRLEKTIRWHQGWAHPCAFGFRLAQSALDGAALTRVLPKLCRLKTWTVAGMSINYAKCFVSHPPSRRPSPGVGTWHGAKDRKGPRGHVPAAPPEFEKSQLLGDLVAGHQWHLAGLSPCLQGSEMKSTKRPATPHPAWHPRS